MGHGQTSSVWSEATQKPSFPVLERDITVDVAIVGAGITGLTTAVLLHQAGFKVAVVEAQEVGSGVSGYHSGQLTNMLLDLRYTTIAAHFGKKGAQQAAESQQASISQIQDFIERYNIDCDFARLPGYLYAERAEQVKPLEQECEAARHAGLQTFQASMTPLPFRERIQYSLMVPEQARLNPYRYCLGLARVLQAAGQKIYEHSRVITFSDHIPLNVKTEHGCVIADHVVLATHTPIGFLPLIQSKITPYKSYIITMRVENTIQDALYWDMDSPYHYLRLVPAQAEGGYPLLLLGGEDHPVTHTESAEVHFEHLEQYARERFHLLSVENRWSAQLYQPADGLPYIGRYGHEPNLYVATGFTGEGLTFGTVAGMLLSDQIRNIPNPWGKLYDPGRVKPLASAREFISQNTQVMGHFIGDRLKKEDPTPAGEIYSDLLPGEGKIATVNGEKRALYCDQSGTICEMSPVCTHARCIVHWNEADSTWDCPCHGGRFSATGEVLNGPPTSKLETLNIHRPAATHYEDRR